MSTRVSAVFADQGGDSVGCCRSDKKMYTVDLLLTPQIFVIANAIAVIMGTAGIIGLAVLKGDESSKRFIANNQLQIANTVVLCFCITFLLASLIMIIQHTRRVYGKPWYACVLRPVHSSQPAGTIPFVHTLPVIITHRDPLRKNMIVTHVCMVLALLVLMICLLSANVLVITTNCWWLQPPAQAFTVLNFLDSTCTNVVRGVRWGICACCT